MNENTTDRRYFVFAILSLAFGVFMGLGWLAADIEEFLFGGVLSLVAATCFAWTAFVESRRIGIIAHDSDDGCLHVDETSADGVTEPRRINPTSGLPMINGTIDVHGNPYGQNDRF